MLPFALAAAAAAAATATAVRPAAAVVLPPTRASLAARQAGLVQANVSVVLEPAFPTNIGFQGPIKYGAAPFVAQHNPVNASANGRNHSLSSIETAYTPYNSTDSSFVVDQHWGNNVRSCSRPVTPRQHS